jgi:hypothetical protein
MQGYIHTLVMDNDTHMQHESVLPGIDKCDKCSIDKYGKAGLMLGSISVRAEHVMEVVNDEHVMEVVRER